MKKTMLIILAIIIVLYGLLWLFSLKKYPVEFGVSFNKQHAEYLGLDWQKTYLAMLDELKPKYIRIAATWREVKNGDEYNWQDVDWQINEAEKRDIRLVLVIGQKAPRWPECHVPDSVREFSDEQYEESLLDYIRQTVERYRGHKALEFWQVENEPFIGFRFGECKDFRVDLVKKEIDLVHRLDDIHWIMITDSGELSTWFKARDAGDIFGSTLYRIVRTPSGRVWTYDWLPAAFYRLKARVLGIPMERFYISELQAEPWFTDEHVGDTPIEEQEKTMNTERLEKHLDYVSRIGTSRVYLWGVEWWYWMKEKQNNTGYWDLVQKKLEIENLSTGR